MRPPPSSLIAVYDTKGNAHLSSREGTFDLSDNLMLRGPMKLRTVRIGHANKSKRWGVWDDASLSDIEKRLRKDLAFDGYGVKITRDSADELARCSTEVRWKLNIRMR